MIELLELTPHEWDIIDATRKLDVLLTRLSCIKGELNTLEIERRSAQQEIDRLKSTIRVRTHHYRKTNTGVTK